MWGRVCRGSVRGPAGNTANQNPILNDLVRLSASTAMAHEGYLTAARKLPGQPVGVILAGIASITGTEIKRMTRAKAPPGIATRSKHF